MCARAQVSEFAFTGSKRNQREIYSQPVKTILHAPWVPDPIITNTSRIARKGGLLDQGGGRNRTEERRGEEGDVKVRAREFSRRGYCSLFLFSLLALSVPSFVIPLRCEGREDETRVRARYPSLHPRICRESMRIDEQRSPIHGRELTKPCLFPRRDE